MMILSWFYLSGISIKYLLTKSRFYIQICLIVWKDKAQILYGSMLLLKPKETKGRVPLIDNKHNWTY